MNKICGLYTGVIAFVILASTIAFYSGCSNLNYIKVTNEFELAKNLEKAVFTGRRPLVDASWGKTIARVEIDGKACIFSHPDSSISYNIALPNEGNLIFKSSVGYHPITKSWGVSDGVRFMIEITDNDTPIIVYDRYVMPKDRLFNVEIPLKVYAGKNILFKLYSINNEGKNANGDWAVWFEPRIIQGK